MDRLPLEVLEELLIQAFIACYREFQKETVWSAGALCYQLLSSVSYTWWNTLNGWPESDTSKWLKHELQRQIKVRCRPFLHKAKEQVCLETTGDIYGVTHVDDKIYILCDRHFTIEFNSVQVYSSHRPFLQLRDICVSGLILPRDIIACCETKHLFIGDAEKICIWKVDLTGRVVTRIQLNVHVLKGSFSPWSLSVTSRRLLVAWSHQLLLFETGGEELLCVSLPPGLHARHGTELSDGTFAVACAKDDFSQLCDTVHLHNNYGEVLHLDGDGHVLRVLASFTDLSQCVKCFHLSVDSEGRMFVADDSHVSLWHHGVLMERDYLPNEQCEGRRRVFASLFRVCYVERTGQLIVALSYDFVKVFNVR